MCGPSNRKPRFQPLDSLHAGMVTEIMPCGKKVAKMFNILLVIGIILLVLWLLGLVSSFTLGGFIYVALVIGLILVIVSLVPRFRRR